MSGLYTVCPFSSKFLMHRVELKEFLSSITPSVILSVPNAPCGVESLYPVPSLAGGFGVPNAPCGVESFNDAPVWEDFSPFLMHRVELKDKTIVV